MNRRKGFGGTMDGHRCQGCKRFWSSTATTAGYQAITTWCPECLPRILPVAQLERVHLCPVCHVEVEQTKGGTIAAHYDTVGRSCIVNIHRIPFSRAEVRSAAS